MYLFFDSKEALYLAVVDSRMTRLLERLRAIAHEAGSAPGRLRAFVDVAGAALAEDDVLRAPLVGEGLHPGEQRAFRRAALSHRSQVTALLAELPRDGQAQGTIRASVDVEAAAAVIFEMG